MKKAIVLAIAVVVGTIFIMGTHVSAAEINFAGEYRVRGYVHDLETRKSRDNSQNYWDQKSR